MDAVANEAAGLVLQTAAASSERGNILIFLLSSYHMNSSWSVKHLCLVETHHCLSLGENLKIHVGIGSWSLAPSLTGKLISLGLNPDAFEVCGKGPT